ncbi:MAG: hypothetical protein IKB97_00320 [Bacteroidaceae bacterium]|nr:hypothetical protein [Bacteroidaceae bacterium]MBR3595256.1 hypothetical protein [Candidatus Saccharibacteria bacterium]MBR6122765.1 hypothetical protein [Candidatus Saccharibacteria bacterium]
MFEIESKNPDVITITTKKTSVTFNIAEYTISGNLSVGAIHGPGEFEIGDVTIRGIALTEGKVIYDAEIGGVHVGIIGGIEEGLDDLGVANVLCTSSVRAIREIDPKVVIAMGNVDGMVSELKVAARAEKKYKVKSLDALPVALEVVALN